MGMLVLTRRRGESIIIKVGAVKVVVKVLGMTREQVKLGTDAPQDVIILREELIGQAPRGNRRSL